MPPPVSALTEGAGPRPRRKIVFLATEDWFFYSHFLPFLREAIDMGLEPVLITRVREHGAKIANAGCRVIPLEAERSSLNPLQLFGNLARLTALLKAEGPDIVHCISLRLVALGGLAARRAGIAHVILAPVGLGHMWISQRPLERMARTAIRSLVGRTLRRPGTVYLFENPEDPQEFGLHAGDPDVAIVGGAGVDVAQFPLTPEPITPPVKVAVVARMTRAKGIPDSLAAAKRARELGSPLELHLFGAVDPSNRGALDSEKLRALCADAGAVWHGPTQHVARVWQAHHIAMLLSEREGLPRSLIEAAACGRPIIATDVTGCRTVVRHEKEGLLVPRGNIEATAQCLVRLCADKQLRWSLGTQAHARYLELFTETAVREQIRTLYTRLLSAKNRDLSA